MLKDEEGSPEENFPDRYIRDRTDSALYMREKLSVGILGATGSVGHRLVQLLAKHPWFDLTSVCASDKSLGKRYKDAVNWTLSTPIPDGIGKLVIQACEPNLACKIVFSALSSNVAGTIEKAFADAGYVVISMAKNYRMQEDVPLVVPEVNADALELVKTQKFAKGGMIVTKPNCAVIGLALALKPLALEFGIDALSVVTMQSISGAGYPGVPSLSIVDNIIPYIEDEEEKLETETQKVLGSVKNGAIEKYPLKISAQCMRVPVTEGHLEAVCLKFTAGKKVSLEEVKRAWNEFYPPVQELKLPSSPAKPLIYFEEVDFPQPKLHRDLEKGMVVSLGRLETSSLFDCKFVLLSHNTIRGAAGGAILIAELLVKKGYVFW